MLETVREYGLERLAESGEEDETSRRHAAWCGSLVGRVPRFWWRQPDEGLLDRLTAEHDNLRAALAWLDDAGDHAAALRLAGALGHFWFLRGHVGEGLGWLERLLATRDGVAEAELAVALYSAGTLAVFRGDYARAESWLDECRAVRRRLGDRTGQVEAVGMLAVVAEYRGDEERAVALYQALLDGAR